MKEKQKAKQQQNNKNKKAATQPDIELDGNHNVNSAHCTCPTTIQHNTTISSIRLFLPCCNGKNKILDPDTGIRNVTQNNES